MALVFGRSHQLCVVGMVTGGPFPREEGFDARIKLRTANCPPGYCGRGPGPYY